MVNRFGKFEFIARFSRVQTVGVSMTLLDFFQHHPSVALAFSGGVDSAYLLYAAINAGARLKAYYVKTSFQPESELEDAKRLAQYLGAEMEILRKTKKKW